MRALSRAHTSLQTHPKVLGASELRGSRALIRGLSHLSHSCFWIESLNKNRVFPWRQTWLTGGDLGPDHAECVQLARGSAEPRGELCGLLNGSGQKYWKKLTWDLKGSFILLPGLLFFLIKLYTSRFPQTNGTTFFFLVSQAAVYFVITSSKSKSVSSSALKKIWWCCLLFSSELMFYQLKEFREFLQKKKKKMMCSQLLKLKVLEAH